MPGRTDKSECTAQSFYIMHSQQLLLAAGLAQLEIERERQCCGVPS